MKITLDKVDPLEDSETGLCYCGQRFTKNVKGPNRIYCSKGCSLRKWKSDHPGMMKNYQKKYYDSNRSDILERESRRLFEFIDESPKLNDIIPRINNFARMTRKDKFRIHCLMTAIETIIKLTGHVDPNAYNNEKDRIEHEIGQLSIKYEPIQSKH
jgi:hypothetical protein